MRGGDLMLKGWRRLLLLGFFALVPSAAWATWTPLITADSFTGVQTDLLTSVSGVMTLVLIILGLGLLIRSLTH